MLKIEQTIPQYILDKFTAWKTQRDKWLVKAERDEEYYYSDVEGTGTNYTQSQVANIQGNMNIPVTINYIYPQVNHKFAILAQSKPSFRLISAVDDQLLEQFSSVLEGAKYSVLYKSDADTAIKNAQLDSLKMGMGIIHVTDENYFLPGQFGIAIEHLHPSYVILDANSKKSNLSDMTGYFITKQVTFDMAKMQYQPLLDEINTYYQLNVKMQDFANSIFGSHSGMNQVVSDSEYRSVDITEYYDMVFTTKHAFEDQETGEILHVFEENFFPEQWAVMQSFLKPELEEKGIFVRKTLFLGDTMIAFTIFPDNRFPIAVSFFEFGGKPYRSYSMIHFMRGIQEAYDKIIQLMITNGILTNTAGWMFPEGSISPEDEAKWEQHLLNPMVLKKYRPVVEGNQVLTPERIQVAPLNPFYNQLLEQLKLGMEYITGVNPMLQGNPTYGQKIDVFSTLQQYQSAAMQRVQLSVDEMNKVMERLGNIVLSRLIEGIKPEQLYIFLDKEQNEVTINGLPVQIVNALRQSKYLVQAVPSESSPTQKLSMATELFKIAQTTQSPYERNIYIQKAFELSDLKAFADMQEEIDQIRQLEQQLNQLQEQIKRDQELMKQMENKVIAAELKAKIADALAQGVDEINTKKAEAKLEIEIEKLKEQLKEEKKEKKDDKLA